MSGWRALARELGVLPSTTKPTILTEPGPREVLSVLSVLSRGPEPFSRDLARDLYEERAAIREHDGGLDRPEAEVLAVADTARALGLPVEAVRRAVTPSAPVLDGEGLPCQPCARCGTGDYWKPACLPCEGPGWRCVICHPPQADDWRHAVSVPASIP